MSFKKGHKHSSETKRKIGLANRGEWIRFNCDYCNKENESQASRFKRKKRHFCNMSCYSKYRKEIMPKEEQNRFGTGESEEIKMLKIKCRYDFNHFLRDNKITRKPCVICGNPKSEGHHFDYSRPQEVVWLCFKHHRLLHRDKIEQKDFEQWIFSNEHPELLTD